MFLSKEVHFYSSPHLGFTWANLTQTWILGFKNIFTDAHCNCMKCLSPWILHVICESPMLYSSTWFTYSFVILAITYLHGQLPWGIFPPGIMGNREFFFFYHNVMLEGLGGTNSSHVHGIRRLHSYPENGHEGSVYKMNFFATAVSIPLSKRMYQTLRARVKFLTCLCTNNFHNIYLILTFIWLGEWPMLHL